MKIFVIFIITDIFITCFVKSNTKESFQVRFLFTFYQQIYLFQDISLSIPNKDDNRSNSRTIILLLMSLLLKLTTDILLGFGRI